MNQHPGVVITGVNGGIGRQIAALFKADGYSIIGLDVADTSDVADVYLRADLASDTVGTALTALLADHSASALVNCAGRYQASVFSELSATDFDLTMAVNVRAPFLLAQAFASHRKQHGGGGHIVNISSVSARLGSALVDYAASKAAVEALTKSLATILAPDGINVNGVAPGIVDTAMAQQIPAELREQRLARIPLKRAADPAEIASVVRFLCSPAASYVTGQTLAACGGMT